jgi:chorismate mutase
MSIKKTKLLVAEVRMIASTLVSDYCRNILEEVAERLEDTEKIAEFYRKEAEETVKRETVREIQRRLKSLGFKHSFVDDLGKGILEEKK